MRRAAVLVLAALLLGAIPRGAAAAQDEPGGASADENVRIDPETGRRYRPVRPPEGMRRGAWPVPPWVVVTAGSVIVAGAVVALLLRLRPRRRTRR
jgi:hypothetical protein